MKRTSRWGRRAQQILKKRQRQMIVAHLEEGIVVQRECTGDVMGSHTITRTPRRPYEGYKTSVKQAKYTLFSDRHSQMALGSYPAPKPRWPRRNLMHRTADHTTSLDLPHLETWLFKRCRTRTGELSEPVISTAVTTMSTLVRPTTTRIKSLTYLVPHFQQQAFPRPTTHNEYPVIYL